MKLAQALVPLKDLVQAKTRLAGLLSPSERRALAQAMVQDVLAVLSTHPMISRVTLVSDDPGAGLLADRYGVECWSERSLGCSGLNAVIARASARLLDDFPEPLLVLHGDLPLLCTEDITAVIKARQVLGGLVIASDYQGTGTNLLAFDRDTIPRFCFGAQSCARHLAVAREAGFAAEVLHRPGTATDVDEARDLRRLLDALENGGAGETAALLGISELGQRIRLTLESLQDEGKIVNGHKAS